MIIRTCIIILFSILSAIAQTVVFEPAELIAETESYSVNERPRIVIDDLGVRHLLWSGGSDGGLGNVRYARAAIGGEFEQSVNISGEMRCLVEIAAGPDLVIRNGFLAVGWEDLIENNRGIWSSRSEDGVNWSAPARADEAEPRTRYLQSTAMFPDGRVSECWLTRTNADGYHFRWTAQDSTGDYLAPVNATANAPGQVCECCYPSQIILDDGNTVIVAFRNNESNLRDIYIARSTDGGMTFPQSTRVDSTGLILFGCPSTGPSIVADGQTVLVTFASLMNPGGAIVVRSEDGGATWSENIAASSPPSNRLRNYPQIALRDSIAAIVWQGLSETNDLHVWASVSLDRGLTWGEQVAVSNVENALQSVPSVAIAPDGSIEVVWKDITSGPQRLYHAIGQISQLDNDRTGALPDKIGLTAYPNPFNASSTIEYELARAGIVRLSVYDLLGREAAVLISGPQPAGMHRTSWTADNFATGKYFLRLSTSTESRVIPLTLTK